MSRFFKENGFLSKEGKELLQYVRASLVELLASEEVSKMDESELAVLGSNLSTMVGESVFNSRMLKRKNY